MPKHEPRYRNRRWMRRQLQSGRSQRTIAQHVGRSTLTISKWVYRHGLQNFRQITRQYLNHRAKRTYANRRWLESKIRAGLSCGQIAKKAGAAASTIKGWAFRLGLSFNGHQKKLYHDKHWLGAQVKLRLNDDEIARKADCDSHTISSWRNYFGIKPAPRKRYPKFRQDRLKLGGRLAPYLKRLKLSARELQILRMYLGIGTPMLTLEQIGNRMSTSRQYIHAIKNSVIARVKNIIY